MSKRFFIACLSLLLFSLGKTSAQGAPIELRNPSFEEYPRPSYTPRGWFDCGGLLFPLETPPDIHPAQDSDPFFGVTQKAYDGDTYLGLVVRENDSYESISQRLDKPLVPGKCYSFSIYLSTSKFYKSGLRDSDEEVDFITPIKLSIKGGNGYCDGKITLAETELITHSDWKEYTFKFEPKRKVNYIVFEARYKTPTFSPPNGNILLDNASAIVPIPCDENAIQKPIVEITSPKKNSKTVTSKKYKLIAKVKNVKQKREILLKVNDKNLRSFTFNPTNGKLTSNLRLNEGINKVLVKAVNEGGDDSDRVVINYEIPVVEVEPEPEISEIEGELVKLREGETIRVDQLNFEINSFTITQDSRPVLNDIYNFLNENSRVSVEIGGHTNRFCDTEYCQTLSTNRAKAVVDFLVQKGIPSNRLTYRGYGKTKQITFSPNAELQKQNQRVEIKILSLGG